MLLLLDIDPANIDIDGLGDALPVTTADPNGIAAALPTGTSWTVAGDAEYITASVNSGKSQHIIVTTGADETTPQSTMTLVGTDRDGNAITDDLVLPSSSTDVSTKHFLTVTGISVDVETTGVTDVGWLITSWNSAETALWVATSAGDGLAHRLGITTTGNEPAGASPLLTLTGTDADGVPITETVTLPNATLVETTKYFLTVTEASTGALAVAGVFDIGWVDEVASKTFPLDSRRHVPSNYQLDVTGTINVSLVFTMDNLNVGAEQSAVKFIAGDAAITSETTDTAAIVMPSGFTGFRAVVNSYSSGGEVQLRATQADLKVAV